MTSLCLHASSERLTLYFYGELPEDERRACEAHVARCEACTATLCELHLLGATLAWRSAASRTPAEWDAFTTELLRKLDGSSLPAANGRKGRMERRFTRRAMAIAATLLLAVGAGLSWQHRALSPAETITDAAGEEDAALSAAAERHFERAKLVVLGIAMKDPAQTRAADWEYERELAAALLPETRLFRLSATDRGDSRLAGLLGDLESVLLQASMTTEAEPSELRRLQRVIKRRDLLVRMDLREL